VFVRGNTVTLRSTVVNGSNSPVSGATVTIAITGPSNTTVTSGASNINGIAYASWKTSAPKGGNGGTPIGNYTATVTNVTATGATWNAVQTTTGFTLN
jgi:hypothetical protein